MSAALVWAQGGPEIDSGPLDDLRLLGAPPAVIDALQARLSGLAATIACEVWPSHWHALMIFLAMSTQWRVIAGLRSLIYQGLDYSSLPIIIEEYRDRPYSQPLAQLMPRLRALEECARRALAAD